MREGKGASIGSSDWDPEFSLEDGKEICRGLFAFCWKLMYPIFVEDCAFRLRERANLPCDRAYAIDISFICDLAYCPRFAGISEEIRIGMVIRRKSVIFAGAETVDFQKNVPL